MKTYKRDVVLLADMYGEESDHKSIIEKLEKSFPENVEMNYVYTDNVSDVFGSKSTLHYDILILDYGGACGIGQDGFVTSVLKEFINQATEKISKKFVITSTFSINEFWDDRLKNRKEHLFNIYYGVQELIDDQGYQREMDYYDKLAQGIIPP